MEGQSAKKNVAHGIFVKTVEYMSQYKVVLAQRHNPANQTTFNIVHEL